MPQEIKRGEIWLVNLDPTVGHEIKKVRPALIIQNDVGNKYSQLTIIAPLTSQNVEKCYPTEVLITPTDSGIEKISKVLLNQIRTVDKVRMLKRAGKLDPEIMDRVNESIRVSLELD